jgi:uncharacterized membrane protein
MSVRPLTVAVAALSLLGAMIAGYLTWVHYAELEPFCVGGTGGCERVQDSEYSDLAGVPVALIGAVGYALLLAAFALPGEIARMAGLLFALVGLGFSLYLTYLELWVIDAICQWCVASAVVMAAITAVALIRFGRAEE